MRLQAESFGAEFLLAEALESKLDCDIKEVHTDKGTFKSLGVIMAMGAVPRQVGFTGESEYRGRGVAYCATCDGEFLLAWMYLLWAVVCCCRRSDFSDPLCAACDSAGAR